MICTILYIMCIILSSSDWEDAMDVKETVACNLRRLRDDRKLSLDAAAQLTGVSKSMLGQIERGDVNPTISVLWKIANGLKISFSALLERAEGAPPSCARRRPPRFWRTRATTATTPFSPSTKRIPSSSIASKSNRADILRRLPTCPAPRRASPSFPGMRPVSVDGTDYPLGPGDSIRFAADRPHGYRNAGTETVELSMVIFYGR